MDEAKTKVLKNGAVYDYDKGRIVSNPGGGAHAITSANAHEYLAMRQAKRQELARQAANDAVQRGDFKEKYGGDAYLVEIVNAAQQKATNIDDPKMIEAARFVLQLTGDGESVSGGSASVPLSEVRGLVRDLADLGRVIAESVVVSE
jgi:hypothetical protein